MELIDCGERVDGHQSEDSDGPYVLVLSLSLSFSIYIQRYISNLCLTYHGDVEPSRRHVSRHHDGVLCGLEGVQRLEALPLLHLGVQGAGGKLQHLFGFGEKRRKKDKGQTFVDVSCRADLGRI